ncbi:indole-3-glycerol-phosphate synthase [Salinarchaeum sp. IM2453]|uniref:indole-3-glycerol-phosphate synthase n=1 Tax=Salinarchaeum sp. IM2453 TaxID=2862870 RepID=UPI001C8319A0|nr:indole-3-glycerol-phosphate synthase [Salinarchaeum sp. IM2453]QZA89727.1 indole-3-glycerol-phosphate synthase [Salinarchaeum sp. IM2453]
MGIDDEINPAVSNILSQARNRSSPSGRISVQAQSLSDALTRAAGDGRIPVIAEIKPTSPTTAGKRSDNPVELAEAMADGGAAALSVLTEPEHFDGSVEMLASVRESVDIPVLRKDFILEESQLDAVKADAVLLIARFLDDLESMITAARDRGFNVLVETHTSAEFQEAVNSGAQIIGINNRDLTELTVDLSTVETVLSEVTVPDDVTVIAESGIKTPEDVERMQSAGADGLLIGSAIMDHGSKLDMQTIRKNTRQLTTPHIS